MANKIIIIIYYFYYGLSPCAASFEDL